MNKQQFIKICKTIKHDGVMYDKIYKDSNGTIDLLNTFKSIDYLIDLVCEELELDSYEQDMFVNTMFENVNEDMGLDELWERLNEQRIYNYM